MASLQKRTVKGKEYWSIVESKRINGKPRPVVIEYIGNTKKLFERLQNNSLQNSILKSFSHGDSQGLIAIAKKLQIEEVLDNIFKMQVRHGVKRSSSLILAAIHRACCPGSKKQFEEWFRTTTQPSAMDIPAEVMTTQHFWNQMDGIMEEESCSWLSPFVVLNSRIRSPVLKLLLIIITLVYVKGLKNTLQYNIVCIYYSNYSYYTEQENLNE